ncbi:MAG: PEP/pyruvate-binding domain-containing protein, partial [Thermodesulfobacteriota bacterium]
MKSDIRIMVSLFHIFKRRRREKRTASPKIFLAHKYDHFRSVLNGNNKALDIITDLEHIFYEDQPFSWHHVRNQAENLIEAGCRIAEDLNALSCGKFIDLFDSVEKVGLEIRQGLEIKKMITPSRLVLPLDRIGQEHIPEVGGKAANLGEISNRVKLPVPKGFAVTAYACQYFLEFNSLPERIEGILKDLDVNNTENLLRISQEIRSWILERPLPPDLEEALQQNAAVLQDTGSHLRLAVRSSATSEDSEASFAGQHSTVLNVTTKTLIGAYKEVVASTFNPRAIFYRRSKGFLDQDVIMSVACIQMVEAKVSGVLYTVDPNDRSHEVILISALWGLGVGLVDGRQTADFYQINKTDRKIEKEDLVRKETAV